MAELERKIRRHIAHDDISDPEVVAAHLLKVVAVQDLNQAIVADASDTGRARPPVDEGHLPENLSSSQIHDGVRRGGVRRVIADHLHETFTYDEQFVPNFPLARNDLSSAKRPRPANAGHAGQVFWRQTLEEFHFRKDVEEIHVRLRPALSGPGHLRLW